MPSEPPPRYCAHFPSRLPLEPEPAVRDPERHGRPIPGSDRLDLALRLPADRLENLVFVRFVENRRNERNRREIDFVLLQERADFGMVSHAPGRLYAPVRRRGGIREPARAVIEERAIPQLQVQPATFDFVQMDKNLQRGLTLLAPKSESFREKLTIRKALEPGHDEPPYV
jgi:hypothetical protein